MTGTGYFAEIAANLPFYMKMAKIAPKGLVKNLMMKKLTKMPVYGTMWWIENNIEARINAYFGSRKAWESIGTWKDFQLWQPPEAERTTAYGQKLALDHGYDESKPLGKLTLKELQAAAKFRGGVLLSESYSGDPYVKLTWRCAHGHVFDMSPSLALKGGHWCPDDLPGPNDGDFSNPFSPWNYDAEAKINPFFAQVWYPLHSKDENNVYGEEIFKGMKGYEN